MTIDWKWWLIGFDCGFIFYGFLVIFYLKYMKHIDRKRVCMACNKPYLVTASTCEDYKNLFCCETCHQSALAEHLLAKGCKPESLKHYFKGGNA